MIWLDGTGGYVIPRTGRIGRKLEKTLEELIRNNGTETLLPVYQERGVYNFYMQVEKAEDVATITKPDKQLERNPFGRLAGGP